MSYASIRPDEWNLPLLLHVLGAMVFVGLLAAIAVIFVAGLRGDDRPRGAEAGLPHSAVRRDPVVHPHARGRGVDLLGGERATDDAAWIGIGYIVTDVGLLVLIAVTVLAGLGQAAGGARHQEPGRLIRPATALTLFLIAAYAVALWAMTAKPA